MGEAQGYATEAYTELARRTQISQRLLYPCAQFARLFPILHRGAKLGWSHYRLLCQVDDTDKRVAPTREASRRGWTAPELESRVRHIKVLRFAAQNKHGGDASHADAATARPRPLTPT